MGTRDFRGLTALVVDDHQNMRRLWKTMLGAFGIREVQEASNAAQALEILANTPVDLAFVDVILEDLSGTELVTLIRRAEDSSQPLLPIIVCTADSRRSTIYAVINSGADEILTKPVAPAAVWQRIQAVVNHRRDFITAPNYYGPDRRRFKDPKYKGEERRDKFIL